MLVIPAALTVDAVEAAELGVDRQKVDTER
jgi:hypothetical protein